MSNQSVSMTKLNPTAAEFVPSFLKSTNFQQANYNPYSQADVDPFEMEARCEAVVEILQDDRVRDHLNPAAASQQTNSIQSQNFEESQDQLDDEEDMMEMMAMQEECRLEMMKFYIQSQNPNLFEEIYHDVSYPDKPLEPKPKTDKEVKLDSAKDKIAKDLTPSSDDYVPKKMSELNLNK
ncbi:unnamed protein product [Brachionus calyciflorus]|uniref:Ataxin-2 C-terminal domain-containing protein n=1 Tax=Brachionus calyciflorus TaxID=104777 RepID=A0A814RW59_9BILA|nr:unnamed protein product [Brachionus calyciflorus]